MSVSGSALVIYAAVSIFGVSVWLASGAPDRCSDIQSRPVVNGSKCELDLNVTEKSAVDLTCTASYSVEWVRLYETVSKTVSYTVSQLTNDSSEMVTKNSIGQNFSTTLRLTIPTDFQSTLLYSCIATQDLEAVSSSNDSTSTINGLRVTKVRLSTDMQAQQKDGVAPALDGFVSGLVDELTCLRPVRQKALTAEVQLRTLNNALLTSNSATLTLETWCGDHNLAPKAKVVAKQVVVEQAPAPPPIAKALLRVTADDIVRYRRVDLSCGDKVLSAADNWYVSNRLSLEMNSILNATQTPFGKVVAPLRPFRRTYSVKFLWKPLPSGWKTDCALPLGDVLSAIPDRVLEHQAIVSTEEGVPISFVVERYTKSMFDFLL